MENIENDYNTQDYSVQNLLTLITKLGDDAIIGRLTAIGRKSSSNTVFLKRGILEESEKADVRTFDIEEVIQRFKDRCSGDYSINSLQSHCSHARRSYDLFIKYNGDPSKFPKNSYKITPSRRQRQLNRTSPMPQTASASNNPSQIGEDDLFTFDLQVPVENGTHMIKIVGIPKNIGKSDIKKISAVILAYSNE